MDTNPPDPRGGKLSAAPAVALVAGSMLGIGIFIMPGQVASHTSGAASFLGLWIAGGLAALFGALCLAELGAMRPRSGGDYEFLRLGWGPGIAFAVGWLQLLVIFPGSLASVAVATASFQLPVLLGGWAGEALTLGPVSIQWPNLVAATLILGLTWVNHRGVRVAGWLQVSVTVIPILVLFVVSLWVLASSGLAETLSQASSGGEGTGGGAESSLSELGHAYLKVYFAYSGWNAAIYVAGEIERPGRNLPLSLVGGTALVTGLYAVLCLGFLSVFGLDGLAQVGEAGTAAAVELFGPTATAGMAFLIFLAMLGSLNGTVLIGSRIAYAMAKRGDCFEAARRLHSRHGTPHVALWAQALISLVLIASPFDLNQLIDYTSSAMLISGTLTVLTVMVLRRKSPQETRPYTTTAYPIPPIGYAASSILVFGLVVADKDPSVLVAAGWFAASLALWHLVIKKRKAA